MNNNQKQIDFTIKSEEQYLFEQPQIKSLNLTDKEKFIWKQWIKDIYDQKNTCDSYDDSKCWSEGFLHYRLIRNDYGEITIVSFPCRKRKLLNNYLIRQFPDNKLKLSLKNRDAYLPDTEQEKRIDRFLMNSIENNKLVGMYLYGKAGIGKSHKIISYCNDLIRNTNYKISYVFMPALVNKVRDNFDADSYLNKEIIRKCVEVDLLVLDDFVAEFTNPWFYLNYLLVILDARANENKPIIVISNFDPVNASTILVNTMSNKTDSNAMIDKENKSIIISRLNDRMLYLCQSNLTTYETTSKRRSLSKRK